MDFTQLFGKSPALKLAVVGVDEAIHEACAILADACGGEITCIGPNQAGLADLRVIARAFEGIVVKISSKQLAEEEVWLQLLYRSLENMGKIVMIAADEAEANEIAYMLEMADFNTPSSLEWEGCWIVIAKKMQTFSGRSL